MNKSDVFLEDYARKHFRIRKNEVPLTRFIDQHEAINAKLIGWPDQESMLNVFTNFAFSSWFKDFSSIATPEMKREAAVDLASGKLLGQGLEAAQFSFILSGMSLHNSHAIVRTRIGASYLQQSQAVRDFRHSDILVPPAFQRFPHLLNDYMRTTIKGKQVYADMLDTGLIGIDDARLILSKATPVWINVSYSLLSLLNIYNKRTDTQEEAYVFNIMFNKMKTQVVEKFPYLEALFVEDPAYKCIHTREGYRSNCVYARNETHQLKDKIDAGFTLHDKTRNELVQYPLEFETQYYIGLDQVNEKLWLQVASAFELDLKNL